MNHLDASECARPVNVIKMLELKDAPIIIKHLNILGQKAEVSNDISRMSNDVKEQQSGRLQISQLDRSKRRPTDSPANDIDVNAGAINSIFYGVFIPTDAVEETNENDSGAAPGNVAGELHLVYTDQQEALKVVKKYPGARFKAFGNRADAVKFSKFPSETCTQCTATSFSSPRPSIIPSSAGVVCSSVESITSLEKGTTFRGPKSQELVKLRKAIESGDAEFVRQTVWANPRYLISSVDTPTILQEGPRYNALHIVAKAKQPAMCQFLLDTIEDVRFMQLLYNDDTPNTRLRRISVLVNFYINTPDKALCETPLHFASKFGCIKVVQVLASHPACDKNVKNKYNQTPKDVICTRYSSPCPELRRQIEEALEDHYFVPVLGAEDNSQQPYVGKPWSPCKRIPPSDDPSTENIPEKNHVLLSSPFVKAIAGPMSSRRAEEFRHRWKTPQFSKTSSSISPLIGRARLMGIRLTDSDKGLERIGRELARESNVPWAEHWSFLGNYCDLSKPNGLNKLETYLRNKYNEMTSAQAKCDIVSQDISVFDASGNTAPSYGSSVIDDKDGVQLSASSSDGSLGSLCREMSTMTISSNAEYRPKSYVRRPNNRVMAACHSSDWVKQKDQEEADEDNETVPKLASGHRTEIVFDHVCRDIATRVTREVCEHAVRDDGQRRSRHNLKRDFLDKVKPSIECLMRLARHHGSTFSKETQPHVTVARHVLRHISDELSEERICASVRRMTSNEGPLASISSSDEESSEDDRNRYRGGNAFAAASTTSALSQTIIRQHLECILGLVVSMMANDGGSGGCHPDCQCDWTYRGQSPGFPEPTTTRPPINDRRDSSDVFSDESTSTDTYHTPPSSIISSHSSSSSDAKTPDEGLLVYINGAEPTKLDVDVLRALEDCSIDPILYPHIYRWKYLVTSYSKEEINNWPTPMSLKARRSGGTFGVQSSRTSTVPTSTPDSTSLSAQQRLRSLRESVPTSPSPLTDIRPVQANLYECIFKNLVNE